MILTLILVGKADQKSCQLVIWVEPFTKTVMSLHGDNRTWTDYMDAFKHIIKTCFHTGDIATFCVSKHQVLECLLFH